MDLTASQWSLLSPLLTDEGRKRRGRPHLDTQGAINGIFWVLRTGARWADLPNRYPPHQTCHRRFREWLADGTLFACFRALADDLDRRLGAGEGAEKEPSRPTSSTETRPRSWKWHTALLLQCPLASQALAVDGTRRVS